MQLLQLNATYTTWPNIVELNTTSLTSFRFHCGTFLFPCVSLSIVWSCFGGLYLSSSSQWHPCNIWSWEEPKSQGGGSPILDTSSAGGDEDNMTSDGTILDKILNTWQKYLTHCIALHPDGLYLGGLTYLFLALQEPLRATPILACPYQNHPK